MRESDLCFYMNITKEENSAFILAHPNQDDAKPDKKQGPSSEQTSKVASVIASVGKFWWKTAICGTHYYMKLEFDVNIVFLCPPLKKRGNIVLYMSVGRSVRPSVPPSVRPPDGFRMISQERLGKGSCNLRSTLIMTGR
ncbi:hypothetical protein DPMN_145520 [Dreissena polymorpha]|uniref:Uncharacterized protein n=1 Tax=Dreissena polymorpha TaxID=45954 RepID=A0A9D4F664_DREPO|nr:hypothetical protein DPMN_145520 [Dreissena polymorpha]